VDNDDIMVEVAPGVNIRMMKRAVVPVPPDASTGVPPQPTPQTEPADDESNEDHEQRADDWNPQDRNI
jgi:hypothetical protein